MTKKFNIPEDEFNIPASMKSHEMQEKQDTQAVQEMHVVYKVQEVQEAQDVHEVQAVQGDKVVQRVQIEKVNARPYGSTQGKKGEKAKRINMAFSDDNHDYITKESRRQGMSATAFVNRIIDEYRSRQNVH